MAKLYASAKLVKNLRIDVDDGRKHAYCLDLPLDLGGTDMGPSALELALMSFAGCYATIFTFIAKKMKITLNDLEVKMEAVKPEEVGTITEVNAEVSVKTDVPLDVIQKIHSKTLENCPVGMLFEKAGVKISYNLKIEK